jgi:hypothetical protein
MSSSVHPVLHVNTTKGESQASDITSQTAVEDLLEGSTVITTQTFLSSNSGNGYDKKLHRQMLDSVVRDQLYKKVKFMNNEGELNCLGPRSKGKYVTQKLRIPADEMSIWWAAHSSLVRMKLNCCRSNSTKQMKKSFIGWPFMPCVCLLTIAAKTKPLLSTLMYLTYLLNSGLHRE